MSGEYTALRADDDEVQYRYLTPISSILSVISNLSVKSPGGSGISPDQRSKVTSNLICAICFEDLITENGDVYTIPTCTHRFHEDCLRRWKREKSTCPYCRGQLPEDLGETGVNIEISEDMDYIVRRLQEIIQEMEGNQRRQLLSWKAALVNVLMCPLGIFLPPMLLVMLWLVETISFCIGIVVLPFYVLKIVIVEVDYGYRCKKLAMIICMFVSYPVFIVVAVFVFVVFQLLYSLGSAMWFYVEVFRCRRRWSDAYKAIVQDTLGFLEERMPSMLRS